MGMGRAPLRKKKTEFGRETARRTDAEQSGSEATDQRWRVGCPKKRVIG